MPLGRERARTGEKPRLAGDGQACYGELISGADLSISPGHSVSLDMATVSASQLREPAATLSWLTGLAGRSRRLVPYNGRSVLHKDLGKLQDLYDFSSVVLLTMFPLKDLDGDMVVWSSCLWIPTVYQNKVRDKCIFLTVTHQSIFPFSNPS